jgi:hypothetical protein
MDDPKLAVILFSLITGSLTSQESKAFTEIRNKEQ